MEKSSIHKKGQYFTTNDFLKESIYKLILNNPAVILEPSCGKGHLVDYVSNKSPTIMFDLYEIDNELSLLENIKDLNVIYDDFIKQDINIHYKTIIGNPPYVKKRTGNVYLEFIEKCFNLLEDNGELIFIVPSDFIKLTSSSALINEMMNYGTFTHIIHPNSENLFANASIDVIVFRYCKDPTLLEKILVNDEEKYLINTNGILTFTSELINKPLSKFEDYFDIFVGMVTGKESVYKNSIYGNIDVLINENNIEKYILLDTFPTENEDLNNYMISNKEQLINRKIKKFNEYNWFEWGALRNYNKIKDNMGGECIYISTISRANDVAFKDQVKYFGGGLIIMIPKQQNIDLEKMVHYLNSASFKSNYMYSGRFKIGQRQLCNSLFDVSKFISHIS